MDKQAAYKEAFISRLFPKATQEIIQATRADRLAGLADENVSLIGAAMSISREHGVLGADSVNRGLNKVRLAISDLDTGIGHVVAGKTYGTKNPSLRSTIFTDSNNLLHDGPDRLRKVRLPSITAPIKSVGNIALMGMGYYKGVEVTDKLKEHFRNRNKAVQHEQGIAQDGSYPLS